jgi:hypothetical protein
MFKTSMKATGKPVPIALQGNGVKPVMLRSRQFGTLRRTPQDLL